MRARRATPIRILLGLALLAGAIGPVVVGPVIPVYAAPWSLGSSTSWTVTTSWPTCTPSPDLPNPYELAGYVLVVTGATSGLRRCNGGANNIHGVHFSDFGGNGTYCFERVDVHDGACAAVGYSLTSNGGWQGGADYTNAVFHAGFQGGGGGATVQLYPIYSGAPTATPAPTDIPNDANLAAYWKLDEASGTRLDTLNGCGGGGCDLTDNDTVGSTTGKVGNSATFNGSTEFLSHANNATLVTGNIDFTVAGWVYLNSKASYQTFFSKWSTDALADQEFSVDYDNTSDRIRFCVRAGVTATCEAADVLGSPSTGAWYFVVAWHDASGDTLNIQVNNGTVDSQSYSGGANSTTTEFRIGARAGFSPFYLNGRIDEVGLWKRVLESDFRTCLYNDGAGNTYPFTSCEPVTPTPTPTPFSGFNNRLQDGEMESNQPWLYWQGEGGQATGRFVGNLAANIYFGTSSFCGVGYHVIGGALFGSFGSDNPKAIRQTFNWPGGTIHVSYSVRGDRYAPAGGSRLDATLTNLSTGVDYALDFEQFYQAETWTRVDRTVVSLPAGNYELRFAPAASALIADDYVVVDDVWVDHYFRSACDPPSPTATPSPTKTATPTRTGTFTPTPTGTWSSPTPGPTATPINHSLINCGFELGSTGWIGSNFQILLAGGPMGPQYAYLPNEAAIIGQNFTWPSSQLAYVTFWAGPGTYGEVRFLPAGGGNPLSVWVGNVGNQWQLIQRSRLLPAGTYRIQALPYSSSGFRLDGVAIGRNGYTYCGGGTPTPGPTAFVSATPTRTPTTGPSPTRTNTAVPSVTHTPNPSATPQSTYTPRPTASPLPTATQMPAEQTATAQGTTVPTYTPGPTSTPGGDGPGDECPDCEVPEQPEPAPGANCVRPTYFWEVAQWIDYTRCEVLKYFAWSQGNTQQLVDLGEQVEQREPFGTVAEMLESVEAVQFIIQQYGWTETGYTGVFAVQRPSLIDTGRTFLAGGAVSLAGDPFVVALVQLEIDYCETQLITIFSTRVVGGVCIVWAWSHLWGITAWSQWFFDLAAWIALIRFLIKGFLS